MILSIHRCERLANADNTLPPNNIRLVPYSQNWTNPSPSAYISLLPGSNTDRDADYVSLCTLDNGFIGVVWASDSHANDFTIFSSTPIQSNS